VDRFQPKRDKGKAMTEVVSFHGVVPLERGLCYCLYLVGKHFDTDLDHALISAARDERWIAEHNRQFGTNLHSQPWLVKMHELHPKDYAPANSPDRTSHCLRSDANPVYRTAAGRLIPAGGKLNWYQRGLDFKSNDLARWFVEHALKVGLRFERPYTSGTELHHVVGRSSPIKVLIARNVIYAR